jgi:hypothetical protein
MRSKDLNLTSFIIFIKSLASECPKMNDLFYMPSCSLGLFLATTWRDVLLFRPHFKMLLKTKTCRHHQTEHIDLYRYQGTGRKLYIMKVDATNVISFALTPPESSSLCCIRCQANVLTHCALLCRIINTSSVTTSLNCVAFPRYGGWNWVLIKTWTILVFKQEGRRLLYEQ